MDKEAMLEQIRRLENSIKSAEQQPITMESLSRMGWRLQVTVTPPDVYPFAEPYPGFRPAPDGFGSWGFRQAMAEAVATSVGATCRTAVVWSRWVCPE